MSRLFLLNKLNYEPYANTESVETVRPPKDAASVCDYFQALSYTEDDGVFATAEMRELIENPNKFFGSPPVIVTEVCICGRGLHGELLCPSCGTSRSPK